jgi:hypothetical protein
MTRIDNFYEINIHKHTLREREKERAYKLSRFRCFHII